MLEALTTHLLDHEPLLAAFVGSFVVGGFLVLQSFKLYRWLDKRFGHINGSVGEIQSVLLDSNLARLAEKSDGVGKRLIVKTFLRTRQVRVEDEEETPT